MSYTHLGRTSEYQEQYNPKLLQPVLRQHPESMPKNYYGFDLWWAYEISWLNPKHKPMVAIAEFIFPANSKYLIESKSLKLYLNSLNMTTFAEAKIVQDLIQTDLSLAANADVIVKFLPVTDSMQTKTITHTCIDHLDITCNSFEVNKNYLSTTNEIVSEKLVSHLLKSNCLVTNQPDWGSIFIEYTGPKINQHNLLKYIVSFRNHNGFHEHCVELCFSDILQQCQPQELTVYAQYTRRGGLDINPLRSTQPTKPKLSRLFRQ